MMRRSFCTGLDIGWASVCFRLSGRMGVGHGYGIWCGPGNCDIASLPFSFFLFLVSQVAKALHSIGVVSFPSVFSN